MVSTGTETKPPVNVQSMAKALHAGQTRHPSNAGEYSFDDFGYGVWEVDPTYDGNLQHQRNIPAGEWLGGLAAACGVELTASELAGVAFYVGRLVGQDKGSQI